MGQWTLRNKLTALINHWHFVLLTFLVAAGMSWGVVRIMPPQYSASVDIYMGIDINRVFDVSSMATYAKSEPFNIDDYKNWQLSQVESIARSYEVADEALTRLRAEDSYWESIPVEKFLEMEELDWRDVGTWRLTIVTSSPGRAVRGVQVWVEVFVEHLSDLISKAEKAFKIDGKLRALDNQKVQVKNEISQIELIVKEVNSYSSELEKYQVDRKLDPIMRWRLWGLAANSAEFNPLWEVLLDEFPDESSSLSSYVSWIDELKVVLGTQKEILQVSLGSIEDEEERLTYLYLEEIQKSKGLSPNLYLEVPPSDVKENCEHQGSTAALVGGLIGMLGFVIVFLWLTEYKGESS